MAEKVKSYRELLIWQKGIELVKEIYRLTKIFPKEEIYALCGQLRRSAVSVPSNIAEGQARQHTGEFKQFLFVALGSLAELDTQLVVANILGYLTSKELDKMSERIEELRKMTRGLISKLNTVH
ncbi:MAG: four helix bundle protein [Deltaproteobacteria bacterium RIFCSPLOWO2_12_FULL_43_16]|nr:MAG: four helix bundle protein [Deltaproteobacteria bacterium GWA2_43_19]OGQ10726.1 MAG: four helix bundle protein [Deltaproteobacteria bacterium RIFCSPHIGHO2_02_FULL_43_33]OGQ60042.1 MAG: four helix bundle protein [Deltaproteobacteria bacterium RIFCSPLOWO2_12_FULL_43_16]HBR18590.1 four helix bundle protein [Deltaproteobacteria bacterium]